jgi:hypothetical protein
VLTSLDRRPAVLWSMSKGCYRLGEMTAALMLLYCRIAIALRRLKRTKLLERLALTSSMQQCSRI